MGCNKSKKRIIKLQFYREEFIEYKEFFNLFDKNRDGKISVEEVVHIMKQLDLPTTDSDVYIMMEEVDLDSSGKVDFGEFLIMINKYKKRRIFEREVEEMFNYLDIGHKGFITGEDLKLVMTNLGEDFDDEDIAEMMAEADENVDGVIDIEEFYQLCEILNL